MKIAERSVPLTRGSFCFGSLPAINAAVITGRRRGGFVDNDWEARLCYCSVCVTGSVTVRTERDEQDATGHTSAIEVYLA